MKKMKIEKRLSTFDDDWWISADTDSIRDKRGKMF